jgi:PKD repeat protein
MAIARRSTLLLVAICLGMLVGAASAGAAGSGQIGEAWGKAGFGQGEITPPALFGVDPVDGSVYVGDVTADKASYRIQKFSASGKFEAAVNVPRWFENKPKEEKIIELGGIAVDHARDRFYLLSSCKVSGGLPTCKKIGSFGATEILSFKTAPEGQALVAAGSFGLRSGADQMFAPRSIAVDPSSGDLVVFGEEAGKNALIQRYSAAGVAGPQFADSAGILRPARAGSDALAAVVANDGSVYTLTRGEENISSESSSEIRALTQAWQLPANLSKIEAVPGFAASVSAEDWETKAVGRPGDLTPVGPQLAISPDGTTLYWKEVPSSESGGPQFVVRGYSLVNHATKVLYGEGKEGRCVVFDESAALGTTAGDKLVVFDQTAAESGKPRVVTFGPGGTGCVAGASARFTVNGRETEGEAGPIPVAVTTGEAVAFDASSSEILGEVEKVEWDFGDGSSKVVVNGPNPALVASHTYKKVTEAGKGLNVKLTVRIVGNPAPAEATALVEVEAPVPVPPKAFLDVVSPGFSVLPGTTVAFSAGMSWDPVTQSSAMKSYLWSFGDGSAPVRTTVPTVSHLFTGSGPTLLRVVTLTVESKGGVTNSDSRQITVLGTSPAEVLPDLGAVAAPAAVAAAPVKAKPKGAKAAANIAKRRKAAVAKCRKLDAGKKRRKCLDRARAIGKGGAKKTGQGGSAS